MGKTLFFQCRVHGFNPWSGNKDPTCFMAWPKCFVLCCCNSEARIRSWKEAKRIPWRYHRLSSLTVLYHPLNLRNPMKTLEITGNCGHRVKQLFSGIDHS